MIDASSCPNNYLFIHVQMVAKEKFFPYLLLFLNCLIYPDAQVF